MNAIEEHSLHAPYIYELYLNVIKPEFSDSRYIKIEQLRSQLLKDQSKLEITDLGAGSKYSKNKTRTVADIAKHSLSTSKISRLLYRLIKYTESKTIIELGTSLGINSLYLYAAGDQVNLSTFEGCPNTAAFAEKIFKKTGADNINLNVGAIDGTLPDHLGLTGKIDLVYFDANHRYDATMRYFDLLIKKIHDDSVFVFADIYWSSEMRKAWKEIKNSQLVTLSIDLYQVGIVFFKPDILKQDYVLEF